MNNKYLEWERELKPSSKILLYGAGKVAQSVLERLRKKAYVVGIVDRNEEKARLFSKKNDINIVLKNELVNEYKRLYDKCIILITSVSYKDEIFVELSKYIPDNCIKKFDFVPEISGEIIPEQYKNFLGTQMNQLKECYDTMEDLKSKMVMENVIKGRLTYDFSYFNLVRSELTYFPEDIIKISEREIFIDCGAYIGDTYKEFTEACSGVYEKYYGFEVDKANFEKLKKAVPDNFKNVLINKGLFSSSGYLTFEEGGSGTRKIEAGKDGEPCAVVTLDETVDDGCTMIKLDTEGCELEILKGSGKLLKKYKPKLMICVYHNHYDLLNIYQYLIDLKIGYKFFLRHQSGCGADTILFAI